MDPAPSELVHRACDLFSRTYATRPTGGGSAPGRVNLIGDHTDYAGGLALPVAIDRACVVVGASRGLAEGALRVVSTDAIGPVPIDDLRTGQPRGWWSYPQGVAAMFAREGLLGAGLGLDLAIASDVPPGSGLGSSTALEVATATCLEALLGVALDPMEKARLCQRAEHEFAGVPCGLMDQGTACLGRAGHALRMDFASGEVSPVPLPAELRVVIVNSGVRHALGDGAYARLHAAAQRARAALGDPRLREDLPIVAEECPQLDAPGREVAEHVRSENRRVVRCEAAWRAGDWSELLAAIRQSHASMRDRLGASCPQLECIVQAIGTDSDREWAARVTGAGFGGCVVVVGRGFSRRDVAQRVAGAFAGVFGRTPEMWEVRAASGAEPVRGLV